MKDAHDYANIEAKARAWLSKADCTDGHLAADYFASFIVDQALTPNGKYALVFTRNLVEQHLEKPFSSLSAEIARDALTLIDRVLGVPEAP